MRKQEGNENAVLYVVGLMIFSFGVGLYNDSAAAGLIALGVGMCLMAIVIYLFSRSR